jgi:riboflavin-specific deaminase-like protein
MLLTRCLPPGPPVSAREIYTGLDFSARAPAERPYIVSNFVASADGRATVSGRTAPLSGAADKEIFQLLRTQVDAVLVGAETVRVERYGALATIKELRELRLREGRAEQPLAIVISHSGRMPESNPLFSDPGSRILFFTSASPLPARAWQAEVHVHPIDPTQADLTGVMRTVRREYGISSVLCEGGPSLLGSLIAEDLVDEYFLTLAPVLVSGTELGIASGGSGLTPMRLVWALEEADHLFLRYERVRGAAGSASARD